LNSERTPGGSSGGESAILALRGSPLGLGNNKLFILNIRLGYWRQHYNTGFVLWDLWYQTHKQKSYS